MNPKVPWCCTLSHTTLITLEALSLHGEPLSHPLHSKSRRTNSRPTASMVGTLLGTQTRSTSPFSPRSSFRLTGGGSGGARRPSGARPTAGGRGGTAGVKAPGRPYRSGRPPKRRMVLHAVNIVTHSRAILFFSETGVGNSRSPAFANNLIIARARPQ